MPRTTREEREAIRAATYPIYSCDLPMFFYSRDLLMRVLDDLEQLEREKLMADATIKNLREQLAEALEDIARLMKEPPK